MRCIVFKEGEPLVHPVTGKALGSPVVELGRVLIMAVHKGYSEAKVLRDLGMGYEPEHRVITQ